MNLLELYNNSSLYTLVAKDLQNDMINHAYILHGSDEHLLKSYSLSFAKQLLCEGKLIPCNECVVCKKIDNGIHSDVFVYPKNSKTIKTEDSNEIVNESLIMPFESDRKIFVLNNFDKATLSAQNKLLKTLEEPSSSVVFILNTTNLNGVLETIKSRSKKVYVPPVSDKGLKSYLESKSGGMANGIHVSEMMIAPGADKTNATNVKKGAAGAEIKEICFDMLLNMKKSSEIINYSAKFSNFEDYFYDIINELQNIIADVIKLKLNLSQEFIVNLNNLFQLKMLAESIHIEGLNELFQALQQAVNLVNSNCSKNAVLESFFLKVLEVKYKCQKQQ